MITLCILTKNAASSLRATLESVRAFPEIILLDNGSTDETLEIGKSFPNVRIFETPFIGFGPLRNHAAKIASNEWIFALDSDEIVSPPLLKELLKLKLDLNCAYIFPRHNFYRGKRIKGCGWDPEWVARLYHREKTSFCNSAVHESLITKGMKSTQLKHPLLHTPYRSTNDFLAKMQHYSSLFAEQYRGKKKSSFASALGHGAFAFFRSYFLKRGWLCGAEGFIISLYNANTTFYKYLKLKDSSEKI